MPRSGTLQRWKPFFGKRIALGPVSVASDWYMWFIPYGLTTSASLLVIFETVDQWSSRDVLVATSLVFVNQITAFLLLFTDPGILPRRAPNASDAETTVSVSDDAPSTGGAFCRHCLVTRPARCHHCYTCGVCVLQHDHHCHIMGSCVGRRSQRWFVSYLFSMVVQLFVGLAFVIRSFRRLPLESDWKQRPAPPGGWTDTAVLAFQDSATFALIWHFALMALIGTLLVPVTAGTLVYVILPMTDTTWREARDRGLFPKQGLQGVRLSALADTLRHTMSNIRNLYNPGPSLLSDGLLDSERAQKHA